MGIIIGNMSFPLAFLFNRNTSAKKARAYSLVCFLAVGILYNAVAFFQSAEFHNRMAGDVSTIESAIEHDLQKMVASIPNTNTNTSTNNNEMTLAELTKNPPVGSIVCPAMTTPVYDRVVNNTTATTTTTNKNKIPKIIHVSYASRCVPTEVLADGIQRWKDELPDYSVYFHDDAAVDRLMEADWPEFPNLHRMMKCIKYKGAMKIDLWRMLAIYKYGGIYTDVDNIPTKNFRNGAAILPEDTFFASTDGHDRPNQNVFAMEPKHPIALFTIETILLNLSNMKSIRKPKVVSVTGPAAFREGYIKYQQLMCPKCKKEELLLRGVFPGNKRNDIKGFKQIHKEPNWYWGNPVGSETVEWAGWNMSKKERAGYIVGVSHWSKLVYWNRTGEDYSCRNYLTALDQKTITEDWAL